MKIWRTSCEAICISYSKDVITAGSSLLKLSDSRRRFGTATVGDVPDCLRLEVQTDKTLQPASSSCSAHHSPHTTVLYFVGDPRLILSQMEGDLVTQQTSRPSHPLLQGGAAIIWSFNSVWDVYNIDSSKRVAAANAHRSGLSSAAHRPLDDVAGKWSIGLSQGLLQSNETIDLEIIDSLIQKDYGIDGYYDSGSCHCNVRVWLCKGVSHPDQVLVLKLFTDVDERDLVQVTE